MSIECPIGLDKKGAHVFCSAGVCDTCINARGLKGFQLKTTVLDVPFVSVPQAPVDQCTHPGMTEPPFDPVAARGMDSYEVRKRWPRGSYSCPSCKSHVTTYASFEHYVSGDW